ncbi:MAG: hypothetical protein K2N34_11475, partial [Lachnospiraceae bacterium]|nr:hypothetical protein [Lachnospiraceae bacterium]
LMKERGITDADLANDPELKLRMMAEASNIVRAERKNKPQTPQAQVPDDEGTQTKKPSKENERKQPGDTIDQTRADFIVGENGTVVSGKVYNMSNADFIQEVADIAEMSRNEELRETGQKTTGRKAGTLKHSTAADIVRNYQMDINDRGLVVEVCYKGHVPTKNNANIKGCTRLDVYDSLNNQVYDYKFVIHPGQGLSQNQVNKIIREGPVGLTSADIHEVNPTKKACEGR